MEIETITDIVREMRDLESVLADKESEGAVILSVLSIVSNLADRIEAAASKSVADETRLLNEITDLRLENARLRAALKPVLARMDEHFVSEIDHLQRTVLHNIQEANK